MSDINITINGTKRLLTAGKYCDKNIVITADGIVPSGTLGITENGTYDVSEYASAEVNVESGGGGGVIDLSSIPEVDSIEKPTTTSPTAVKYDGEIYLLVEGELNNG